MKLKVYRDYPDLSADAANAILEVVRRKPDALLCLAAGDTPRLAYTMVAERAREQNLSFSQCHFVALDEWVGIPPDNEGSCNFFLETLVFAPLQIPAARIHRFDALSPDLDGECRKADQFISDKGGIDLMVVGVGTNGHIGFNEPGASFDSYSHVIDLDESTRSVGQKYFREATALKNGITLGLRHLIESRMAILIANGARKAGVIRRALEDEVSNQMPASIMRLHRESVVMIDQEAASLLQSV